MVNYAPPTSTGRRASRRPVWIVLAVLAAVVCGAIGWWLRPVEANTASGGPVTTPGATPPGPGGTVSAPHGPAKITNGVPSGYTRDKAGAATAAVNSVQLVVNLAHNLADPATAQTRAASTADPSTRTALSAGGGSAEGTQTSKTAASTQVTAYSDTDATVKVWVVSVGTSTGGFTAADWSTHTVRIVWEGEDWKVAGLNAVKGPKPGDATATQELVPLQSGMYTYYLN